MGEEQKKQENPKADPDAKDPSPGDPKNPNADDASKKKEPTAETNEAPNASNGEEKPKDKDPPPPPEEIIMRVFMHCEGCARKVQRCLRACEGVEDVLTDSRAHRVVAKGRAAAADPLKVVERLQRKTGRKVELLTPVPPKPEEKPEEEKKVEAEPPKPEEKKEEPQVIRVVLKVHMHCEACAMEIKKRILKMKGVQSVEADLKASEVAATGVFDAPALVDYVHKRTGKHAAVARQEVVESKKDEDPEKGKEEEGRKKDGEGDNGKATDSGDKAKDGEGDADEGGGDGEAQREEATAAAAMAAKVMEMRRNEMYYYYYNYYYPRYQVEPQQAYPPQMFSDENPNACSLM